MNWTQLRAEAVTAMRRAYAPYSRFPVGAAALADDGRLLVGWACRICGSAALRAPVVGAVRTADVDRTGPDHQDQDGPDQTGAPVRLTAVRSAGDQDRVTALLEPAAAILTAHPGPKPLGRRALIDRLRADGHPCSTDTAVAVLAALREQPQTRKEAHA